MSRMDYGLTATPHPQPIDLADLRPGDVFEARHQYRVDAKGDSAYTGITTLYLLDRPDPDADLIRTLEGIDQSLHGAALGTWGRGFLDALAAAGLTIEPKPEVNHLHA